MFRDREDAARQVAAKLRGRHFIDPLVLAIPRGGVVLGAVIARELEADLDVVLSRKLRDPWQPELAMGALSESGEVFLNSHVGELSPELEQHLKQERKRQQEEIERRKKLFRAVRPHASIAGRSVILTDDGIATGATMIAGLHVVNAQKPHEVIVAAPVGSPDRLVEIEAHCNEVVCLLRPQYFWAIGQFYEDFSQVEDEEVVAILREFAASRAARNQRLAISKK